MRFFSYIADETILIDYLSTFYKLAFFVDQTELEEPRNDFLNVFKKQFSNINIMSTVVYTLIDRVIDYSLFKLIFGRFDIS